MKILFVLTAVFLTATVANCQSKEDLFTRFKRTYNIINIQFAVDVSRNTDLITAIKTNSFISQNIEVTDLNFTVVNEVTDGNDIVTINIPFKKSVNKALTIQINKSNFNVLISIVISEISIDSVGTGNVMFTTVDDSFINNYTNGNLNGNSGKRNNCFRTCFDAAYDDICDGFIGCVAWHVNPLVPLTAASYCQAKCL